MPEATLRPAVFLPFFISSSFFLVILAMSTSEGGTSKATLIRQLVLLGILAMLGFALYWDWGVSLPRFKADLEMLREKGESLAEQQGDSQLTPEAVAELLGRKPCEKFEFDENPVEVFCYRRGLPFQSYKLFVIYNKAKGELRFATVDDIDPRSEEAQVPPPDAGADPMPTEDPVGGPPAGVPSDGPGGPPGETRERPQSEDGPPGEPASTEPASTEPAPTEPAPTEPAAN